MIILVWIASLILASSQVYAAPKQLETIYVGVNANYTMPLVDIKNPLHHPEVERGILKDLGEALLEELHYKPVWILLPKYRVAPALTSGDVGLICHLSEVWQPKIKNRVRWSQELYTSTNVIIHLGKNSLTSLKDLYGEQVGTVTNFIYQNIDDEFRKKKIVREDAPSNESNIRKLTHGRLKYIIMSNLEFEYYKKIYPILEAADFKMDTVQTKCALSKKSKISLADLNRAIETLKRTGQLQKILRSY